MMFESIKIQNFRSLKLLEINDLKQFNLIVGGTNVGKTSILEAFFIATNPGNLTLMVRINDIREIGYYGNYYKNFFHFFNTNNDIKITTHLKNKNVRKLNISPYFQDKININNSGLVNSINAELDFVKIDGLRNILIIMDKDQKVVEKYNFILRLDEQSQPSMNGKTYFKKVIVEELDKKKFNLPFNTRYEHAKTSIYSLNSKYDEIVRKLRKKDFLEIISSLDPYIIDIDKTEEGIIIEYEGLKESAPIGILGNGMIKTICIIAAILTTKSGVVLIDEIENGIHYLLLNRFWKSILEAAKKESVQIICTTHSLECVKLFYSNIHNDSDQLRVYRTERNDKNENEIIKYEDKDLKIALEENWEVR